jgi:hypothetical protein
MKLPPQRFVEIALVFALIALPASGAGAGNPNGNGGGGNGGNSPGQQAPSSLSAPSISGTTQAGQTLNADPGGWSGVGLSFAYQWQRCPSTGGGCVSVGANSTSYALSAADVGYAIAVVVTATNKNGSASASSPQTALVAPVPAPAPAPSPSPSPSPSVVAPSSASAPTISGSAQQGQTLSAATGSWNGTQPLTYAYQWQRCNSTGGSCVAVNGATAASYLLGSADVGSTIRAAVTASNSAGSATASSAATAVVAATTTSSTSTGSLTWAPPALSSPITVQVSNSGQACPGLPNQNPYQPFICFLAAGQDYILKINHRTASATDPDGLVVTGGRNVVIIGGEITISAPSAATPERYGTVFHSQTGTVHVEGVLIDGYPANCFVLDAAAAIFQLENNRCSGIDMYMENFSNPHSDILRTWKSPSEVRIDGLTGEYDNTGLALYGQQQSNGSWTYPGHVVLKHVNLRNTPANETQCSNYALPEGHDFVVSSLQTRVDIDQMYTETGWGRASNTTNCPAAGSFQFPLWGGWFTYNGQTQYTAGENKVGNGTSTGSYLQFTNPSADNIWGPSGAYATVNYGIPPGGDYVPTGVAGTGYTSPGYQ